MADRSQPDANNIHSLIAVSNADGVSPVTLWADPTTHALVTSGSGGGASGTQYTQGGATVANPTGTAQIYFDNSGNPKAVTPATPLPVSQTDGTNTANVLKSDGTSAGQNGALVAGNYFTTTFSFTGSAAASTWLDLGNYNWVSVHIDTFTSGTANFQTVNDTTKTAVGNNLVQTGVASTSAASSFAAAGLLSGPLMGRYFRINATGSPTFSGTIIARSISGVLPTQNNMASQSGTWTVGSNSATGSAVPANVFAMGALSASGFLQSIATVGNLGDGAANTNLLAAETYITNGTTNDRLRGATSAAGTTGTGVPAAGMLGQFNTSPPIYTTGQYGQAQIDARGSMVVQIATAGVYITGVDDNTDGQAVIGTAGRLGVAARNFAFNGTSHDRMRNNWNGLTSDTGAKTASFNGATQTNYNAAGANIVLNIGTVSGTAPTLTAQLQGSADTGTTWFNITGAVTPSITASGVYVLTVYPGISAVANASVPMNLPRTWRLSYTIGGTTPSFTITNVQVAYNN